MIYSNQLTDLIDICKLKFANIFFEFGHAGIVLSDFPRQRSFR